MADKDNGCNQNNFPYLHNTPDVVIFEADLRPEVAPSTSQTSAYTICELHGDVKNLFCTTCIQIHCFQCIPDSHSGHPLDNIRTATARGVTIRSESSWDMEDIINDLTLAIREVEQSQTQLEAETDRVKNNIQAYMYECHVALKNREKELLRRLADAHTIKKTALSQQEEQIKENLTKVFKSYRTLRYRFPMTDPVLQHVINTEARGTITAARAVPLTPVVNSAISFSRDSNMRVRMRYFLGNLEVGDDAFLPDEDGGYNSPESELD